jgi:hypothetical protein
MPVCLLGMRITHGTILSHRMIEDSGKRGNTMAERRQLFAEMSKYGAFKELTSVFIEYS